MNLQQDVLKYEDVCLSPISRFRSKAQVSTHEFQVQVSAGAFDPKVIEHANQSSLHLLNGFKWQQTDEVGTDGLP